MVPIVTVENITLRGMPRNRPIKSTDRLVAFVRETLKTKGLALRDVETRSRRAGKKITHSYLSKLLSGSATNLSMEKLEALAAGLGVSFADVLRVVGQADTQDEEAFRQSALHMLYEEAKTADPETRKMIDWTVEMLLDQVAKTKSSSGR
jgi:transcriptional regulator with XRE-family HTH domain